jgi:hypothetical protein
MRPMRSVRRGGNRGRAKRTVVTGIVVSTLGGVLLQPGASANASEFLPSCGAPKGQHCLAIDNKSDHSPSYRLNSFLSPDGRWCLSYKSGWGPGDTVGWKDIFVNRDFADNPTLRGFLDTNCHDEVADAPVTARKEGDMNVIKDGYVVIAAGPYFVTYSQKAAAAISWCVKALDKDANEIAGDCDKVAFHGQSTFWVPTGATKIYFEWSDTTKLGGHAGHRTVDANQDWCFRMSAGGSVHEATDKPCTRD